MDMLENTQNSEESDEEVTENTPEHFKTPENAKMNSSQFNQNFSDTNRNLTIID